MKKSLLLAFVILVLVNPSPAQRSRARRGSVRATRAQVTSNNGCDLAFTGKSRKAVKLRPTTLNYSFNNGGRAISVNDWFGLVCTLDPDVPATKRNIPGSKPMAMEKLKVKMKAYVLAFKRDPDNDLHVQIGDAAKPYKQTQVIVEIPPGAEYCEGRSNLMDLMRADGGQRLTGNYVFREPPLVEVTGYLFLDAFHIRRGSSDYCTDSGGRGIKNRLKASPVRGLWEIHPVTKLEKVSR